MTTSSGIYVLCFSCLSLSVCTANVFFVIVGRHRGSSSLQLLSLLHPSLATAALSVMCVCKRSLHHEPIRSHDTNAASFHRPSGRCVRLSRTVFGGY